ncbi:TPA: hypothetical protein RI785_003074 [Vibrio cholerae]|uniref:Uncharacterized protein n=1 Tax=Vibrio cholerae TaxID=666 RepID=A0A5Q6PDN4_VIBCL|nr:hypothetical protein [Vibrio cholerae]KAA1252994.1 hypothetical protein F0M16_19965 [Vibrio cholerae]HDV5594333.1 hypothetical protein [Vibrio cholerae]
MTIMSKIETPSELPDSGVAEYGIQYANYVYTKDGRIGIVRGKAENEGGVVYGVDFYCSNEIVVVSESKISHIPTHPIFDAYIQSLLVMDMVDKEGNFNQDERVSHVIENYETDYVIGESEDVICYCPFTGTHFELNSKTGYYQCVTGIECVQSKSLHEGAKLAFEWAWSENGLLDPNSEFLKNVASKYKVKGLNQNVLDKVVENLASYFEVIVSETSGAEFHQTGEFTSKAVQSVYIASYEGESVKHVLTVDVDPDTLLISIDLKGEIFSVEPVDGYFRSDAFSSQLQMIALFEMLKDLKVS